MRIRTSPPAERPALVELWERSVRATHTFLTDANISSLRPLVVGFLGTEALDLHVLVDDADVPVGFMVLADDAIDALFLEPSHRRLGNGRRLVVHAQGLRGGSLRVDVNEQNADARNFYGALGFVVIGRSPLDDDGRPFPLLHMRRDAPASDKPSEPRPGPSDDRSGRPRTDHT